MSFNKSIFLLLLFLSSLQAITIINDTDETLEITGCKFFSGKKCVWFVTLHPGESYVNTDLKAFGIIDDEGLISKRFVASSPSGTFRLVTLAEFFGKKIR